jgi:hypothetical protein
MSNSQTPTLSVPPSAGMMALMEDPTFCKHIARSEESLMLLVNQLQRDIVCQDNAATVGYSVLAMKNVQDLVLVVAAKGHALIAQENKDTN